MKKKPLLYYLDLMKSALDKQEWIKTKRYGEAALKKLSYLSYSPIEECLLYYRLDYAYDQLAEYSHSFDVLYKANLVATKHHLNESNIAFISFMLGKSFVRIKSILQALAQFQKVEQYYQRYGYDAPLMGKENYFNNLISLGYCYFYKNNLEQVREIIEKKLSSQLPLMPKRVLRNYYHLKGEYLIAVKDFSNARQSLTEFLKLGIESNLYRPVLEAKIHIATIDLLEGKIEFVIETLTCLLKEAGQLKANEFICSIGLLLSKCYTLKNMQNKAIAIERRIKLILNQLDITWLYEMTREFEQIYRQLQPIYQNQSLPSSYIPQIVTNTIHHHYNTVNYSYVIIGKSALMMELYRLIEKIAPTDLPVLIQGETGTGKELIAKAVHNNSSRSKEPWLAINCGAIAESLLENTLFGHIKGAFTDAKEDKKGYIELASEGTLFLDEIAEMSPAMQQKLLRVLEEKQVWRVGSEKSIPINTRFIFASNQNIEELVNRKRFRLDLFYRINTITINLPSLRDRKEDISLLINHFLAKYSPNQTQNAGRLTPDVFALLQAYPWPGNVRELENEIKRICALYPSIKDVTKEMLSETIRNYTPKKSSQSKTNLTLTELTKSAERNIIIEALNQHNGNITYTAQQLGCLRQHLQRKIRKLRIDISSQCITKK
jgi:transcriptional regulator with PAS, ATPase and Fis domain